jgi:hypothetical protein
VISDDGTVPVTDRGQLEGFFAQAIEAYNATSERSHYILRLGDDGQHRIQAALTMTAS